MKEFNGIISEYKRKDSGGWTSLVGFPGGVAVGPYGGALAEAMVKIGGDYLLKLEVVHGLASYMERAHSTRKPCTLYIHRRRLIGIKLDGGEIYFYRKPVILASFLTLFMLLLYYFVPFLIIIFPLTILWLVIFWKVIWEVLYRLDGRKLKKLGGIPLSVDGDRLDLRSAI
ncbi:MAG: hypothetical protein KGK10_01875 [Rhodospirillales bacterium]|nr:hypothetical protein [Rhodospirillales bacterium]